jgi:RNA polymerase sigma-70 factor (ECF subfamily)
MPGGGEQVPGVIPGATREAIGEAAVEGQDPGAAAATLGISLGAVYIARSRVMARLRAVIEEVEDEPCSV